MAERQEAEPASRKAGPAEAPPSRTGTTTGALPASMLALQSAAGNAAVSRLLSREPTVQRGFRILGVSIGEDAELTVEEVIRRDDPDLIDNLPPARLTGASEGQKLTMLGMLSRSWAGNEDEALMRTIWGSFADPAAVANTHIHLWRLCIARGADLESLPVVQATRRDFEADVKAVAHHHLSANRAYVLQEMRRLGIAETGQAAAPLEAGQRAELEELQRLAVEMRRAQALRAEFQQVVVGYDLVPEARPGLIGSATTTPQQHADDVVARRGRRMLQPATYDPFRPPHHAPFGDEQPPMASYERTKGYDDEMARYLAGFAARSPAMYALLRDGRLGDVSSPGHDAGAGPGRGRSGAAGHASPHPRDRAQGGQRRPRLAGPDAHPQPAPGRSDGRGGAPVERRLPGVGDQRLPGGLPGGQFWMQLGLSTLAAAAFLVAELATVGTATFFIAAGIGLGITAGQAAAAWENYGDLQTAAGTTMSAETEMVTQGQASTEMVRAAVETALAFLALVGLGARAARAVGGAAAGAQGGEAAVLAAARGRANGRIAYMQQRVNQAHGK